MGNLSHLAGYGQKSDDELMVLVQQGDLTAFEELYNRYKEAILTYCRRLMGDIEAAKDIFQKTFIQAFEHRSQYSGGNFRAWLYKIALNCARYEIRNQKRRNAFAVQSDVELLRSRSITIPEEMADVAIIREAMQRLSDEDREILELRYIEGLSYRDIAAIMGLTESHARVRVFRAKKSLQKILLKIT